MSFHRALARFAGAMLATMTASVMAAPAAAAPPYTLEERAIAIATPSLVFVETIYTGYLKDRRTGASLSPDPVVYHRRCSGFAVNREGSVVTTTRCVQPQAVSVKQGALFSLAQALIDAKKLPAGGAEAYVAAHMPGTAYTGLTAGEEPKAQYAVQMKVATAGLTSTPALSATLVAAQAADAGNIAILKTDPANLPAVEVNKQATPANGDQVILLGFSGTSTLTPRTATAHVIGASAVGTTSRHQLDSDDGETSGGGLAVDNGGRVVGVIDTDPTAGGTPNRAFVDAANILGALADAGVQNTLSTSDVAYRDGLDAYYAGRYSAAITKFDQVIKDNPENYLAASFRQKAADRQTIETEPSTLQTWLIPLVSGVGGAVIVGLILFLVFNRRAKRRERAEADLLVPVSLNPFASPVSGAPTSGGFAFPPETQNYDSMPKAGVVIPQPAPPGTPIPAPPALREAMPSTEDTASPAAATPAATPAEEPAAPKQPDAEHHVQPVPQQPSPEAPEADKPAPEPFVWPADDDYVNETQDNPWSPRT